MHRTRNASCYNKILFSTRFKLTWKQWTRHPRNEYSYFASYHERNVRFKLFHGIQFKLMRKQCEAWLRCRQNPWNIRESLSKRLSEPISYSFLQRMRMLKKILRGTIFRYLIFSTTRSRILLDSSMEWNNFNPVLLLIIEMEWRDR